MSVVEKRMPCPACQEDGKDTAGDNLTIFSSGKFSCVVHPGDKDHNRRIIKLLPEMGEENAAPVLDLRRLPTPPRVSKKTAAGPVVARYSYHDQGGQEVYQVWRHDPKGFSQHRIIDGEPRATMEGIARVPYRLPKIAAAETVIIVEGEKDVETVEALGYVATCNAGGAGKWQREWSHYFQGKQIVLCGDNDDPGRKHIEDVESALRSVANSIRRATLPEPSKDISDYLAGLSDTEAQAAMDALLRDAKDAAADGITRKSLLELYLHPPDKANTLLGNRWLCRRGCLLIVAPTGVGKSSASAQMDVCWTAGKPAFGIVPAKPLRILTIQVENDEGDLHEMVQGVVNGMKLSDLEIQALGSNNRVITMQGKMGPAFTAQLAMEMDAFPCDILRIDPATGFYGDDVKDAKAVNQFCRAWLQPLLDKHDCGLILILHTPKTNHRDTSNWKDHDWMYAGAGSADWSNFARAILIIEPKEYPLFEFRATKRKQRIGWMNANGHPVSEQYWAHSQRPGEIYWEPASPEHQKANAKVETTKYTVLELVPMEGTIEKKALVSKARTIGVGDNRADDFIAELIHDGLLEDVAIPRSGTRPAAHVKRAGVR